MSIQILKKLSQENKNEQTKKQNIYNSKTTPGIFHSLKNKTQKKQMEWVNLFDRRKNTRKMN